jgi:hypothetical protein
MNGCEKTLSPGPRKNATRVGQPAGNPVRWQWGKNSELHGRAVRGQQPRMSAHSWNERQTIRCKVPNACHNDQGPVDNPSTSPHPPTVTSAGGRTTRAGERLLRGGHHFGVPLHDTIHFGLKPRHLDLFSGGQRGREYRTDGTVIRVVRSMGSRRRLRMLRSLDRMMMAMLVSASRFLGMSMPHMARVRATVRLAECQVPAAMPQ